MKKFGLDFGTTNSSVSVSDNGKAQVLSIDKEALDARVIRSMLYFARRQMVFDPRIPKGRLDMNVFKLGEISYEGRQKYLIGQEAVDAYLDEHKNRQPGVIRTIYTGRFIQLGTASEDQPKSNPVAEYYEEIDYGTGRLLQALKSSLKTNFKGTTIFGQFYSVEELISLFVKEIKQRAELTLGEQINEITVGRPVYFSQNPQIDQKAQNRLEQAIKLAGFSKVNFEFEPVAAAKQFSTTNQREGNLVLVFDFGGGTLDTALVKMGQKPHVLATDGVYIGGDLLNADIMQHKLWDYFGYSATWGEKSLPMPVHIYQSLNSWYSIPSLNNPDTLNLLNELSYHNSSPQSLDRLIYLIKTNIGFEIYEAIERAKKQLSTETEAFITYQDGPIDLNLKLTRDEFEDIIQPRVEEVRKVVLRTLEKGGVESKDVAQVVRTGGSSLIPVFENMLTQEFGKQKISLFETFTSIAGGLAL